MEETWSKPLSAATKKYEEWATKYSCQTLEDYFRGKQWKTSDPLAVRPYSLNLFYSTIKIKLANYLVNTPYVLVNPKPRDASFNLEQASQSAAMKEAFLNTILSNKKNHFNHKLKQAIRDSYFRFGLIEVGYSANFIINPKADRPDDSNPEHLKDPEILPESEFLFFKRINPARFLVSEYSSDQLEQCDWYGYYDFATKADFEKATKKKINTRGSDSSYDSFTILNVNSENTENVTNAIKFWRIWDNRTKEKYLVLDSDGEIYHSEPFTDRTVIDFRWDFDFDGFYPIPPTYHWLSQQDEINDVRQQASNHRRRFVRKFQTFKGDVSNEEMEKFSYGEDGAIILLERPGTAGIVPIQNADLGAQAAQALVTSRDDFNIISGTSSETRGVADRQTATQAQIIENRSNVRETAETEDINNFITEICDATLILAAQRLILPVMVESRALTSSQLLQELSPAVEYKQMSPDQLNDGMDYKLTVDISSTSPAQLEAEKTRFIEFVSIMANFPQIALSPVLIREAAYKIGYKNEAVIKEFQNAALLNMIGMQQEQAQGPSGTGEPQRISEQAVPPTQNNVEAQQMNTLAN